MEINEIEKHVDDLKPKRKGHAVRKRTIVMVMAVLVGALMITASATLLIYFNKVETTMTVAQSVQLDGKNYNELITHDIPNAKAGCCYCYEHNVTNNGCEAIDLTFTEWGTPDLEGIAVSYYEVGTCCDHELETLEVKVLDGSALDDDFEVYVDGTLVFTYDAISTGAETWINHVIDLTTFDIVCCGQHNIEIVCTATSAWSGHSTYGQLAVDTISLYCEGQVLCDSVDIGNPTSEAGHQVSIGPNWGPIEPATSNGYYGGITDCRVTWEPGTGATIPERSASCVLSCEDCYDQGCQGCEELSMDGFTLEPEETLDFCICYKLDALLIPGTYTIHHELLPS